ncbi:MAG: hypothetical protein ACR2J8_14495 [Thermomicrobiales bacterium]
MSGMRETTVIQPGLVEGRFIGIHVPNLMGFEHVTEMLLEHVDEPAYAGTVFILGDYVHQPVSWFREQYPGRRIVIYQLEQMVGSATWHPIDRIIDNMRGADAIWDYDPLNVAYLSWYGVEIDRVVPMLYTERLRRLSLNPDPPVDVLFAGSLNDRRYQILFDLQRWFYGRVTFAWVFGLRGVEFDRTIENAKIILNLHAFEPWHRQEQTRIFFPLINGRMVVSETSEANGFGDCIVEADPGALGETILYWLAEDRWKHFGPAAAQRYQQASHRWLDEHRVR